MNHNIIALCLLLIVGCAPIVTAPVLIDTTFSYTAPGDDGGCLDDPVQVQIRMALSADSLSNNWSDCRVVLDTSGMPPCVYDTVGASLLIETGVDIYFMARGFDDAGNWSPDGNIITRLWDDNTSPNAILDLGFAD